MQPNYDDYNDNKPIVCFSGDDDEDAYCDKCGLKLIPWDQGRMLCTDCERLYDKDGVLLHRKGFGPVENKHDAAGAPIVSIKTYHDKKAKKKPSVFDREDKAVMRAGFSWISDETITYNE